MNRDTTRRETYTAKELLELPVEAPKYWRLDKERLTLDLYVDGRYRYEVDLERCTTPAEMLDWIFQLQSKGEWLTDEMKADLLYALDYACNEIIGRFVQGAFCSFGVPHKVDWVRGTSETLEAA